MKRIATILPITFLSILIFSSSVFSQNSNIIYPIAELGNCGNLTECKDYCDEAVHKDACISYATTKGFYNSEVLESQKEQILQKAKTELGCATKDECQSFCSLEENLEICSAFAKKNNLPGGKNEASAATSVLQKAKTELGCTSKESCKTLCSLDENKSKCSEFAKANNLDGGVKKVGPGGCSEESECIEYCKDESRTRECSAFGFVQKKEIKGPGGCSSAQTCQEYCIEHPEECQEFDAKRKQETEVAKEKKGKKIVEKTEQKKENVQEKKSILRIFNFLKPNKEVRNEVKVEPKTEVQKEPTRTPTPTITKVPETESDSESESEDSLYKNTLELDGQIEACIQEGCIWKQTYCNCAYKYTQYPIKTPTPIPTEPVSDFEYDNTKSDYEYQSQYQYNGSSLEYEYEHEEEPDPTPTLSTTPISGVQGASTGQGIVHFLKSLFD